VVQHAVSPVEAHALLQRLVARPGHLFLVDDVPLVVDSHLSMNRVVTQAQVTDAHLVALARRHGARLATFDRTIEAFAGPDNVELIPFN